MNFKLIDIDEHALVVTVARSGLTSVMHPRLCSATAADILRQLADQLDAAHPPYPCDPAAAAEPPRDIPATLGKGAGSYDADRHVWTDGAGHPWDLSVTWEAAATGGVWEWANEFDRSGTPVMRTVGAVTARESLDILRTLYGPITPTTTGRCA
ncbi:phiSA1p31-related protein [Streptomyces sp. NPDC008125]|uniref:phiSA1p31-related protein n=1 Tax=Streptomyces sp. NPDC008125 TaxID=3364811 RepID=UPI0036E5B772